MDNTTLEKRCNKCKETKSLDEFPQAGTCKGGRRTVCKTCYNKQQKIHSVDTGLTEKHCKRCGITKPISRFSPNYRHKGGFQDTCKDCRNKTRRRYSVDVTEKRCSKCQVTKPADQFYRVPTNKHGLDSACKDCQCTGQRSRYQQYGGRKWPDKTAPERQRDGHLKRKYGVTQQEYDQILIRQNGRCICGVKGAHNTFGLLYVDHNHETGAVRGLLCQHCNQVLGYAKDSPEQLMTLAAYLIANQTNVSTIDLDLRQLKRIGQRFTESMTRLIGFYKEPLAG